MHSSAIGNIFNGGRRIEASDASGDVSSSLEVDAGLETKVDVQTRSESLLSLAKSESLRSAQRRQLASAALGGFPIWDLALFLFENHYENRRVTLADMSNEIQWSKTVTLRYLELLQADGMVRIRNGSGGPDISATLCAKAHETIANYLLNAR